MYNPVCESTLPVFQNLDFYNSWIPNSYWEFLLNELNDWSSITSDVEKFQSDRRVLAKTYIYGVVSEDVLNILKTKFTIIQMLTLTLLHNISHFCNTTIIRSSDPNHCLLESILPSPDNFQSSNIKLDKYQDSDMNNHMM